MLTSDKATDPIRKLRKQTHIDRLRQQVIPSLIGMEIIPRLQGIRQLTRHGIISDHCVKVQHRVKRARGADKVIELLPRLLPQRTRIRLKRRIPSGRRERRNRRSEQWDVEGMDPRRDLLVRRDESVVCDGQIGGGFVRGPDVVDTLEDHGVLDTRVGEDVSVNSRKYAGT